MTTEDQFKVFERNIAGKVEEYYQALVKALQPHLSDKERAVFALRCPNMR